MKEIYVDKIPTSCKECVLRYIDEDNCIRCNLTKSVVSQCFSNNRSKDCPLKQLTNAQLAIGWYQDDEIVVSKEIDITNDKPYELSDRYEVGDLLAYEWKVEPEIQYTLTDWKGAREATKSGKKVTNGEYSLHTRGNDYIIVDKQNLLQLMTDELYDSKEWKIWE